MEFEDHLKSLVYFHLEEHTSAQHLLQVLKEDDFARDNIAPDDGIEKSSFSEATNSRGLEQFAYVFAKLQNQAGNILPQNHPELGDLVGIDGSLIDAVLFIARSKHGLMVQILAGLITYLLLVIYCHQNYNEKVSIKRVRELRIKIQNELRNIDSNTVDLKNFKEQDLLHSYAKT